MKNFQQLSSHTWPNQWNGAYMSKGYVIRMLDDVVRVATSAGDIKRRLFYDTDNSILFEHKVSASVGIPNAQTRDIAHGIIGVVTVAAELAKNLQRIIKSNGHTIDIVSIKEDVGGTLFYLANLATACGFTLEDAMAANIHIETEQKAEDVQKAANKDKVVE